MVATSISEFGGPAATTVTITRNTDTTDPLDVALTSSDTTEASIQTTATIPAGQSTVTVDLDAVDDLLIDGDQTVTITASALDSGGAVGLDAIVWYRWVGDDSVGNEHPAARERDRPASGRQDRPASEGAAPMRSSSRGTTPTARLIRHLAPPV